VERETIAADRRPPIPKGFMSWHPLARAQYLEIAGVFLSPYLLFVQATGQPWPIPSKAAFPFLAAPGGLLQRCRRGSSSAASPRNPCCGTAVRDWLPEQIRQRGKRPYRAPIHRSFLQRRNRGYVREMLVRMRFAQTGLFNPRRVEQLVARLMVADPWAKPTTWP